MTIRPGQLALLKAAMAAAITISVLYVGFEVGGIRVNASSSLPIGLYIKTSARRANLVEFCPPEPFASFSKGRGYRPSGSCPDAAEPLMKPVVAAEGDIVEVSASGVAVNGRLLPNSSPRPVDTRNRPLASLALWEIPCRRRHRLGRFFFQPAKLRFAIFRANSQRLHP